MIDATNRMRQTVERMDRLFAGPIATGEGAMPALLDLPSTTRTPALPSTSSGLPPSSSRLRAGHAGASPLRGLGGSCDTSSHGSPTHTRGWRPR
jgi:hypothetical protein